MKKACMLLLIIAILMPSLGAASDLFSGIVKFSEYDYAKIEIKETPQNDAYYANIKMSAMSYYTMLGQEKALALAEYFIAKGCEYSAVREDKAGGMFFFYYENGIDFDNYAFIPDEFDFTQQDQKLLDRYTAIIEEQIGENVKTAFESVRTLKPTTTQLKEE